MENSLDHLFGNLMGGLDEIVEDAKKIAEKYNENYCEFCKKPMSQKDHDFCDICPDCFDNYSWLNQN